MLQIREERYMLYMKGICFFIQYKIIRFPAEYFSFIKDSLKNFRVLDIYQTKLIEHDKSFEPNLLSFFITQSSVASCMSTDFTKWNSFVDIFSRKSYDIKIQ